MLVNDCVVAEPYVSCNDIVYIGCQHIRYTLAAFFSVGQLLSRATHGAVYSIG